MPFFKNKYRLCEMFGIPIYLDVSLAFLLLMFLTGGGGLANGLLCALMLLVSITAHEFGHALTARAFGYATNDITLSLLGGCASLIALPRKPKEEFLTAIAGPAVSLALSFTGIVCISLLAYEASVGEAFGFVVGEVAGSFGIPLFTDVALRYEPQNLRLIELFLYCSVMNGCLAVFNLLPGFPLDGGRVFRSAMRRFMSRAKATYVAMLVGRGVAVLIGLRGLFGMMRGGSWSFVSILIAWMIWREGYREYLMARQEEDFRRWTQDDFNARVSPPPYGR